MTHLCPYCGTPTSYQVFSGGKEWYCEPCDTNGCYPADETPRRLKMLQSPEGVVALRAELDQELARRRDQALLEREDLQISLQQMRDGLAVPLDDNSESGG